MNHDYTITGVDATSTGTSHISFVGAHLYGGSVRAEKVIVEQTGDSDAEFNIELDGNDVFADEQTVDAADTPESLDPDQNEYASDGEVELALDVSSAGTSGNLNVTVVLDDGEE